MTTPAEVRKALRQMPELGLYGFEEATPIKVDAQFVQQTDAARRWLREGRGRWRFIRRSTTYGMKHAVEEWVGHYIPTSAMVLGAVLAGFRVARAWPDSPNGRLYSVKR